MKPSGTTMETSTDAIKMPIETELEKPSTTSTASTTFTTSGKSLPWNTSGFHWTNGTATASNTIGTGIGTIGTGVSSIGTGIVDTGISTHTSASGAPMVTDEPTLHLPTFNHGLSRPVNATHKITVTVTPLPRFPVGPHALSPSTTKSHYGHGPFPSLIVNGTSGVLASGESTPCATSTATAVIITISKAHTTANIRRHDGPHTDSWNSTLTEGALAPPVMPAGTIGTVGSVGTVSHVHPSGTAPLSGTAPTGSSHNGIDHTGHHHEHPSHTEHVEEATADPTTPVSKPKPTSAADIQSASYVALVFGVVVALCL